MNDPQAKTDENTKRTYETPRIEVQGRAEELTQWIGGRWGEFFNGQGDGWNPWATGSGS